VSHEFPMFYSYSPARRLMLSFDKSSSRKSSAMGSMMLLSSKSSFEEKDYTTEEPTEPTDVFDEPSVRIMVRSSCANYFKLWLGSKLVKEGPLGASPYFLAGPISILSSRFLIVILRIENNLGENNPATARKSFALFKQKWKNDRSLKGMWWVLLLPYSAPFQFV